MGETSSDFSLDIYLFVEFRLSHHLSAFSHLVVHAAFACALLARWAVQVNQREFNQSNFTNSGSNGIVLLAEICYIGCRYFSR